MLLYTVLRTQYTGTTVEFAHDMSCSTQETGRMDRRRQADERNCYRRQNVSYLIRTVLATYAPPYTNRKHTEARASRPLSSLPLGVLSVNSVAPFRPSHARQTGGFFFPSKKKDISSTDYSTKSKIERRIR